MHILYGYLLACGRAHYTASMDVSKIHIPCPMTGRADSMVFSAFVKVHNFGLGWYADQSDEMYRFLSVFCGDVVKKCRGVFVVA